jgi:mono/diheme cytochrome c family protein
MSRPRLSVLGAGRALLAVGIAALAASHWVEAGASEQSPLPGSVASASPAAPEGGRAPAPASVDTAAPVSKAVPPSKVAPVSKAAPPSEAAFAAVTHALFEDTCSQCHNGPSAEGNFDVSAYGSVESLASHRGRWERVLQKLRSGEMPPEGFEPPKGQVSKLIAFLDAEFARADASIPPDSGRVTARRLNRAEYTNTIRDLLAVDFRADKNFPTDDSGDGFDNIGDVLTVSPILMDRYLAAAARIADRAIAATPLPKPIEVEYSLRLKNLRRLDPSNVEATHRIDFDANYDFRIGLPGARPLDAKPVTLGLWVDGKLTHTMRIETKPSQLVYFEPYSVEQFRVSLPEGDHSLRLGFIDDAFVKKLKEAEVYEKKLNKWIGSMTVVGPFPSTKVKPSRKRLLTCDPQSGPACVQKVLSTVAQRAYRRPVTPAEVAELTKFVGLATGEGQSVEQGIGLALQAMLVSPHFLFHIEQDRFPNDPTRVHPISDVELASRLSYFLWNSMPDDELLGLAMRGKLRTPEVLDAQVDRMLADPKALALAENFAGQWLEIRNLDSIRPDPDKFPIWSPELRDAMRTETQLFFTTILRKNRSIVDFIDARYTFLNELLAKYYGIEGVTGPEFRRVSLTTAERGGVLSQASVLAVSSYPTRTSVAIRGKYVLQNILASPPPPPPPDVPALDERAVGTTMSLRQQMEAHRANAVCASCHSRMDPLGFGLENYDALGKWRTDDGGFPVDSSGVLPGGKSFSSPAQMRQILVGMLPDFSRCLTEKMLTYALGRGLAAYDRPTVRAITTRLAASGYGLQTLVHEVVRSLPFQSRRAEAALAAKNEN